MSLVERMKASRKVEVTVGEITFTGRRPTLEEFGKLYNENANSYEIASRFITNWEGVKESHLFSSGSDESVPFSGDVFREYISDSPEVAEKIRDSLVQALNTYLETKESLKKN